MQNLKSQITNGNAETEVVYDEKKSDIFWSQQFTSIYPNGNNDFQMQGSYGLSTTSIKNEASSSEFFDTQLKSLRKVPKPKK